MKAILGLGFVFLMLGQQAHAGFDVLCLDGDCLSGGWEITDMNTGERSAVRCANNDCFSEGWTTELKGEDQLEVVCKPMGCFIDGWRTFDIRTGAQTANVSCYRGHSGQTDCLMYGWETVTRQGRYPTMCINGDCNRWGWESRFPGYPAQVARCKAGGCFNEGWTVRP